MRLSTCGALFLILVMAAGGALAAGPTASPDATYIPDLNKQTVPVDKAFGDYTDYRAAAVAGANYLRMMQADITDDNAGNGLVDDDPDDGGWDWESTIFEHSTGASTSNTTGATANGLYQTYLFEADPAFLIAMKDAADGMIARGPSVVRSAADAIFLLDFASLADCPDPAYYRAGAMAIWNDRMTSPNYSNAVELAEYIRDVRGVTQNYPNGIIPWDIAPWAEFLMKLHAANPGMGYDAQAAAMADVLWRDSFDDDPGLFDPDGASMGNDPTGATREYWWYTLGVSGLIRAFEITNTHTGEIPGLLTLLLECQYPDGAFSYQYGAPTEWNNRNWQTSAYAVWALHDNLPLTGANADAFTRGVQWLAATQDVSGGFVYSNGEHNVEVGGECVAALAYGWRGLGATLSAAPDPVGPVACGETTTVTFSFAREGATVGVRGYEMTLQVNGPVDAIDVGVPGSPGDFADLGALAGLGDHYFRVIDNLDGTYTVNDAVLGTTPGLLNDADLFTLNLVGNGNGPVTVDILSYKLRDPDNVPVFADALGTGFTVDCTAPDAVTDIVAETHHNRVAVSWTHDGIDTAVYEVYRGLWYDLDPAVSAYPEYDDLPDNEIPTRPSNRAVAALSPEWELAGTVTVGTTDFDDLFDGLPTPLSDRAVCYYEVFAVDAADNGSLAADDNDRATNYWLGDVNGDGFVDITTDIDALGASFATTPLDVGSYNPHCDVGPTDDWSRLGIPFTDNLIDFEDLMIFAMNYAVVSDVNKADPQPAGSVANVAWVRLDDGVYALRLLGGAPVQGVRVRALVDTPVTVSTGTLADMGPVFFKNVGEDLDANLALLGVGAAFRGEGDLLVIETAAELKAGDLAITLRGADNSDLEVSFEAASDALLPAAYDLQANYPNPFNPNTTIKFALPEAQDVRLSVYGVDGKLVTTLLNETRGAGHHEVVWKGQDDAGRAVASGTYFYRLVAGPYSQVRKMTLMK